MSEQDHDRVERELSLLIRQYRTLMVTSASTVHTGLELSAYATLRLLDTDGPLRASTIGERFALDKSTVSRQLSRLIDWGLVERTPDPSDGRAHLVAITPTGHDRLTGVSNDRKQEIRRLLELWDEKDVAEFGRLLELFNRTNAG
ncbi:MarR family winged helix-turn-helix transcriptional regulator [Cryptosporangium phraense]|uniref:Winged helix-turn-helix transcriptional regulator n=1 Tax=Cryptosporangium phraense TaxID=2593070 RepID=A0A545AJU0_9ACTN|nr:MarR family winged helix-turn-helix transcriptional regulator [Cryptosporangium phraense]TQS40995.1 winged helix-turn-helix transcriptional regulator [Cryptosporangium phraense]